ncbi:MAG: prephenate dehydrogenase/arogenate dehydrogenase family protein, partial [Lachnospiraceae bacterium]|nr:prephenate dehydrogenase/arogenate dehydrogenase family protein [Lachnospiraceae bacterium]
AMRGDIIMDLNNMKIGFIGFGLIAGSIARALRKEYPKITMIALNNRYPDVKLGLKQAVEDKVLNELVPSIDEGFSSCDIIYLAAPVITNISYLPKIKPLLKEGAFITDVGSVKGDIHKAVTEAGLDSRFIGGHPMAGTEKSGYENSFIELLENAYYILTPTDETPKETIDTMLLITKATKSRSIVLSSDKHDIAAAAISHVPHILSYSLVNTVKDHDTEEEYMKQFAAGGFRDMTRIASSSPEMWQNIVMSNKDAVLTFLSQYLDTLEDFRQMLVNDDKDAIYNFFEKSKEYRDSFKF